MFVKRLSVAALLLGAVSGAQAAVIGHWRMEADNDAAGGLSVPNEIGTGPALPATAASLVPQAPSATLPQTGQVNTNSLNGDTTLNGTITAYGALNSSSTTV